LVLKLGDKVIDDKTSLKSKTNNPKFYKHYDLPFEIPGNSTLTIEVWDDDGILPPDFIGMTSIDLEKRHYSKNWNEITGKKPVEYRPLTIPTSKVP